MVFTICAALSIAFYSNFVRGLRDSFIQRVSKVRDLLEDFFDNFKDSDDPDVKAFLHEYIIPLLSLSTREWHTYEEVRAINNKNIDPIVKRIHKQNHLLLPRYLLRIEDELNETGLLFIRRLISELHVQIISGTFHLIAFGILTVGLSYLIDDSSSGNSIIVNLSIAVIAFALLELLLILSFMQQEAREEGIRPWSEEEDIERHTQQPGKRKRRRPRKDGETSVASSSELTTD